MGKLSKAAKNPENFKISRKFEYIPILNTNLNTYQFVFGKAASCQQRIQFQNF